VRPRITDASKRGRRPCSERNTSNEKDHHRRHGPIRSGNRRDGLGSAGPSRRPPATTTDATPRRPWPTGLRAPRRQALQELGRFHRGEKLSPAYRSAAYRVDYRRYNLAPPPRGYEYVRVNNDVVLTAVATGVITAVLMDLFQ
jgi:Ni/Co efflux regulator RcnB